MEMTAPDSVASRTVTQWCITWPADIILQMSHGRLTSPCECHRPTDSDLGVQVSPSVWGLETTEHGVLLIFSK